MPELSLAGTPTLPQCTILPLCHSPETPCKNQLYRLFLNNFTGPYNELSSIQNRLFLRFHIWGDPLITSLLSVVSHSEL
jgi:hypothetical protein